MDDRGATHFFLHDGVARSKIGGTAFVFHFCDNVPCVRRPWGSSSGFALFIVLKIIRLGEVQRSL